MIEPAFGPAFVTVDFTARAAPPEFPPPCPVIGIGAAPPGMAARCDVLLASPAGLPDLAAAIARSPIAAAVLVQTLRLGEFLGLHAALLAESLAYATLQDGAEARAWRAAHPPPAAPAPRGEPLHLTRDGATLTLRLNRPHARNAIDRALRDALNEALDLALLDETITRVVLTHAGPCFSIGGALCEFGTAPDPATAHAIRCTASPAFRLARLAPRVQARVASACIGAGAELAALCGHVTAAPGSFFQLPELRMGLIPGSGGTAGIARRIGRHRAGLLMLTGRRLSAPAALQCGLIDRIGGAVSGESGDDDA